MLTFMGSYGIIYIENEKEMEKREGLYYGRNEYWTSYVLGL